MHAVVKDDPFYTVFRGSFTGLLKWEDLDAFWQVLRKKAAAGWYVYAIGEPVPTQTFTAEQLNRFVDKIDALLRQEHQEDYCSIVYTDSKTDPSMIKIFDPNNLGVQCGFSNNPPLPGWVMSLLPPLTLDGNQHLPAGRKRWWRKLWD